MILPNQKTMLELRYHEKYLNEYRFIGMNADGRWYCYIDTPVQHESCNEWYHHVGMRFICNNREMKYPFKGGWMNSVTYLKTSEDHKNDLAQVTREVLNHSNLTDVYDYIAMDECGAWHGFRHMPKIDSSYPIWKTDEVCPAGYYGTICYNNDLPNPWKGGWTLSRIKIKEVLMEKNNPLMEAIDFLKKQRSQLIQDHSKRIKAIDEAILAIEQAKGNYNI